MKLLELANATQTKRQCVQLLQEYGVIHKEKICRNGHSMTLVLGERHDIPDRWRCQRRTCRHDIQLRKDTWLQGSRLPYRTILFFCYSWAYEMTSIEYCERELGMSHCTTVDWSNYLREICASALLRTRKIIGGPGLTVEIDESQFSRRKNNVGRVLPAQWVFGGTCRETGDCFLYAVPNRTAATLIQVIKESIAPGSTIMSDCWKSYDGLTTDPDYIHLKVNHSLNFVDPLTGAHTQTIESLWRNAKIRNKRQFGTHRAMLDSYLCEFLWRRTLKGRCPFEAILNDMKLFMPPK